MLQGRPAARTRRSTHRAAIALGIVLALLTLAPAGGTRGGNLLPHPGLSLMLTVDGAPAAGAPSLRLVAGVLQRKLGLPLPARITARIYEGRARFEQGLVTHGGMPAARAAEMARFAVGAAIPGSVLLVAPARAAPASVEWPRLIAHELTHLAQIELAVAETGPAQWLAEGMAEWAAYQVIDRLGLADFEPRRAIARAAAREYVRRTGGLDLDALATAEGFVSGHQQAGTLTTYRLALYLVDELVARHGLASLVGYFRAFRVSREPARNFEASFRLSVDTFEQAALAGLAMEEPRSTYRGRFLPLLLGPRERRRSADLRPLDGGDFRTGDPSASSCDGGRCGVGPTGGAERLRDIS